MGRATGKKASLDLLREVSRGVGGMITISDMEEVRYVPTILTGYNRATGIGGHPLGRITVRSTHNTASRCRVTPRAMRSSASPAGWRATCSRICSNRPRAER